MDSKDKKILSELANNSRIPLTRLGKRTGISREVINYRIQKLEQKTIRKYSSQIDIQALGYQRTACYLILKNCTSKDEEEVIKHLIGHKQIAAISINIGKYDIIFDIFYRDNEELLRMIEEIEKDLENKAKELFCVNTPVEQRTFYNKLFNEKEEIKTVKTTHLRAKENEIDSTDLKILRILNSNARESLVNISRQTAIKANAVGYRIRNLEKSNIITNSTIFIDFETLGFDIYNIQVKINSISEHNKIKSFLKAHKKVLYYYQYYGNKGWDIDIGLFIKDKQELKGFIRELKEKFGEIINFKEMYMIDKIYKEELPKGLFVKHINP